MVTDLEVYRVFRLIRLPDRFFNTGGIFNSRNLCSILPPLITSSGDNGSLTIYSFMFDDPVDPIRFAVLPIISEFIK